MNKKCRKCQKTKPVSEFVKNRRLADGYGLYCKICSRLNSKKYYEKHREREKARIRAHQIENKEHIQTYKKKYRLENKDKIRDYNNEYNAIRYASDESFRICNRIGGCLYSLLTGKIQTSKYAYLIGCSVEEWRAHIESTWKEGMNWENYGTVWQVDHIRPRASFDHTVENERAHCFNYKNTQALSIEDHLKKTLNDRGC